MRTWWIEKVFGKLEVKTIPGGWLKSWGLKVFRTNSAIGPYFNYKEALHVLHIWNK